MRFSRPEEEEISLNLAPLIDVVFLLLIFFMITTTFNRNNVIDLTLPEASSRQQPAPEFSINISVSKYNEVTVESDQTRFSGIPGSENRHTLSEKIQQAIERLEKDNPGLSGTPPTIIIEADKDSSHGQIIKLMDAISQLGINKIQFAVAPENPE